MMNNHHITDLPTFLRTFDRRADQVMWFLGAGASSAAGIKTAGNMIWDFKQTLYRSHKKLPPSAITDIGDPIVQQKLQHYFEQLGTFPPLNSETEYQAYFEATYPSPKDRRSYLDEMIRHGKPSYGHWALTLLMTENLCKAVWTTNFDRTLEDAASATFGSTGKLLVADLGEPKKLSQAWGEARWPIYAKLHGDYHSEALKNVDGELRSQDTDMRSGLINACKNFGLAIVGYSGRDRSIMETLTEAIDEGKGFPGGIYWFIRPGSTPYKDVLSFIELAKNKGIEAHLIESYSFDELMSDIVRYHSKTSKKAASITGAQRPRLVKQPIRAAIASTPVLRTNALLIKSYPAICRLVQCSIGGQAEVEEAIAKAGVDIDAYRCSTGVLAFGKDKDIEKVFENHSIQSKDTHPLNPQMLAKESGQKSIIRDSLFRALAGRPGLSLVERGRKKYLIPDPKQIAISVFNTGIQSVDKLRGKIGGTEIVWSEACGLRIDYRFDKLWLLLSPWVIMKIPEGTSQEHISIGKEFIRQRIAARRNQQVNSMLDGWVSLIVGEEKSIQLRAFSISDGIDPEFEILKTTAFAGKTI